MKRIPWVAISLMCLGAWLIASPFLFRYSAWRPAAVFEDLVPGVVLLATSAWVLVARDTPVFAEWVQALCGVWLVLGAFVLLFSRVSTSLNDLIIGFAVMVTSLIGISSLVRHSRIVA
ncbi:MAG TPA: hypothetical protein VH417_11380 [Vicinamibacterales bacterium]|jgi:hypothetical protein